jgi:hypothetical protein
MMLWHDADQRQHGTRLMAVLIGNEVPACNTHFYKNKILSI